MNKGVLSLSLGVVLLVAGLHAQVNPGAKLNLSGESLERVYREFAGACSIESRHRTRGEPE